MNHIIISQIDEAQKRMGGYIALLNYRFKNLCVKADIAVLLPVSVYADGEELNIEDVANVNMPDDYQLGVYPKDENDLQSIIQGVYEAHPEFKMEMKSTDDSEESKYLLYTMPEVDKNRRDFLMNGVKGLKDECLVRIEAVYADYQARFAKILVNVSDQDVAEANKALDKARRQCKEMVDDLLFQKEQEIEEGYQRYLEEKEKQQEEEEEMNFSQSFRMYNVEE